VNSSQAIKEPTRARDTSTVDGAFRSIERELDGDPSGAPLELLGELSVDEAIRVAEFRSALRRFMRHSERAARSAGLTPQRYLLLLMIKGAPEGREQSTVTELAERLQLAQSTVTELVDRAEEAGLVERARSAGDRRVAHLRLTPEGERRLAHGFEGLSHERGALRFAFAHLDSIV
jgi:DNA-binding MarR family transcriptional regulator